MKLNRIQALQRLRRGVDISIVDGKIYPSQEINYNEGVKMQAIYTTKMTNREIMNWIRESIENKIK